MKNKSLSRDYPLSETKMSKDENKKTSSDTKNAVVYRRAPGLEETGQKVYQGPLDKDASGLMRELYPSTEGGKPRKSERGGYVKGKEEKLSPREAEQYNRSRYENELRRSSESTQDYKGGSNFLYNVKSKKKK